MLHSLNSGDIKDSSNTYYREPRIEPFDIHRDTTRPEENHYQDMSRKKADKFSADNNSHKENLRAIDDYRYMIKTRDEEISELRQQVTNFMTAKLKQRQTEGEFKKQMIEQFNRERELQNLNIETREQEWKENVNQIATNIKTQYTKREREISEEYEEELRRREMLYKGEIEELKKNLKEARQAALYIQQDEDVH